MMLAGEYRNQNSVKSLLYVQPLIDDSFYLRLFIPLQVYAKFAVEDITSAPQFL
jgi:hypothetical protein